MVRNYLILLLLSFNVYSEGTQIHLGYGAPYKADESGSNIYSISIEHEKWRVDYSYWQDYTRSSWDTDKYPTWQPFKVRYHNVLSVSRNIYKYDFSNQCNFYLDFGLAYTTNLSRTTSSPVLFHESLGYQCGWWKFEINHRSNGGIQGENTGADGIHFKFLIWEN